MFLWICIRYILEEWASIDVRWGDLHSCTDAERDRYEKSVLILVIILFFVFYIFLGWFD